MSINSKNCSAGNFTLQSVFSTASFSIMVLNDFHYLDNKKLGEK